MFSSYATKQNPHDDKFLPHYGSMEDGFPRWLSAADRRRFLQTSENGDALGYNEVMVAQDGSDNYTTITEALTAAPNNSLDRYVIYIREGIYCEYIEVPIYQTNIILVGDGIKATVITGNRSVADGWTTYSSATFVLCFTCFCDNLKFSIFPPAGRSKGFVFLGKDQCWNFKKKCCNST